MGVPMVNHKGRHVYKILRFTKEYTLTSVVELVE